MNSIKVEKGRKLIWARKQDFGTYHIGEQRRLRRDFA